MYKYIYISADPKSHHLSLDMILKCIYKKIKCINSRIMASNQTDSGLDFIQVQLNPKFPFHVTKSVPHQISFSTMFLQSLLSQQSEFLNTWPFT